MRVLIDTSAYSALGRGNAHIRDVVETVDELIVSTIVLGELHASFSLGSRIAKNRERAAPLRPAGGAPPRHPHVAFGGGDKVQDGAAGPGADERDAGRHRHL